MTDNNNRPSNSPDRLAPHHAEAEEAVLGSILINPDAVIEIASFLQPDDFFIVKNSWVYGAILSLYERREAIDSLTISEELRIQGRLENIGGPAYLIYLSNNTPTHIHAETYARYVERASIRRKLLGAASDIAQIALEENAEITEVTNKAEAVLFSVTARGISKELTPLSTLTSNYFDRVKSAYESGTPPGLPTGFIDLDALLRGLHKADLTVVAARPGAGKTSFILSLAVNAWRLGKARIAIYSIEMSEWQLTQRLLASETGINSTKLETGQLDDNEWARFTEATMKIGKMSIFIDDTPALALPQLRSKSRRFEREHGLDLIIVDYLQLLHSGLNLQNEVQEVSMVSRALKELARELNVPVLAAAQLSRAVEQRADKRPILSDLRSSGTIEQDADNVLFIYRDDMYNENSERVGQADVIVAKQRNGPTGVSTLFFQKELTRFTNMTKQNIDLRQF